MSIEPSEGVDPRSADWVMRERMFGIPVIEFEQPAFTSPPPLDRARVAIGPSRV